MSLAAALGLLCALAAGACAQRVPPPPEAAADSLRGTVAVVGSEPANWVVLRPRAGGPEVRLEGDRSTLERLAGLEVVVRGAPEPPRAFRVERFAVRASGGVAALDGTLAREGGGYVVVLSEDGRRVRLPWLPEPLRAKVGARVWLAGPPDQPPDSWGVIAEP